MQEQVQDCERCEGWSEMCEGRCEGVIVGARHMRACMRKCEDSVN